MTLSQVNKNNLYDRDYVQWIEATLQKLRDLQYENVDWENLLEEIEDMGKRERQALRSNLVILLLHLLKWQFQPEYRTGSWAASITEHRRRILDSLDDSPSLKSAIAEGLEKCYKSARKQAHQETGLALNLFPPECTYSVEEILDDDFWP